VLAVVVPYVNTLGGEFIWDDDFLIRDNSAIKNLEKAPHLFSLSYWTRENPGTPGQYRPLRALVFAVSYSLWGLDPLGYRLTNLILYALLVWLVYGLGRRLIKDDLAALMAGLLFALHPAHTEVVAWVKNLTELMGCLFVLIGLWAFWRGEEGSRGGYVASVALFPLALISKETAVVYPLLLAAWVVHSRPAGRWLRGLLSLLPHAMVLAGYGLFLLVVLAKRVASTPGPSLTPFEHVSVVLQSAWAYLQDLFFPISLNAERLLSTPARLSDPILWATVLLLVALAWFWHWLWKRRDPSAYSLAWMLLALLPVLNIRFITGRSLADQRVFLASVGACWLMGHWLRALVGSGYAGIPQAQFRAASWTLVGMLFVCAGIMTHQRNRVWIDPLLLYEDTVSKSPTAERAHYNLGNTYKSRGEWEQAIQAYKRSIEINPSFQAAYNNLGIVHYHRGEYEKAEEAYLIMLRLKPDSVSTLMNLGALYKVMGRYRMAQEQFERVLSLDPQDPEAQVHLGEILAIVGLPQEAEARFRKALEVDPRDPAVHMALAELYLQLHRREDALKEVQEALRYDRDLYEARMLLGDLLAQKRQVKEAIEAYEAAQALRPSEPGVHLQKGLMLEREGRLDDARREYDAALSLDPRNALSHLRSGALLRKLGNLAEAEAHLLEALAGLPQDPQVHLQMARLYLETERGQERALSHLKEVLRLAPDHPHGEEIQRIIGDLETPEASSSPGSGGR
jgi:tetratricopeptide (TPR) repeat protein